MDWLAAVGTAVPENGFVLLVLLLSLRIGPLFAISPLLSAGVVPGTVRVLFVVGLATALALGLPDVGVATALNQPGPLLVAALSELALGAVLAFGVVAAFAAVSFAGRLVDIQVGFGIAQVYDPATRGQVTVVTSAFNQLALLLFFLMEAHHALLRGIAYTLERFPPGRAWSVEQAMPMVAKQMAGVFTLGFALAAPVVVCLLLLDLALGVVSRNLPQMNMFVLGIPAKIVVGLLLLALWFTGIGEAMGRAYALIFRGWHEAFAVQGVR